MRTIEEIKNLILEVCANDECPSWLIGEVGQLINELETTIHAEYNQNTYEQFKQSLTLAETEGLTYIMQKIQNEGIISINALSKETGISRPVFNNLINKLENSKIIIMQNMGAKGTYIKFINQTLLKERGI